MLAAGVEGAAVGVAAHPASSSIRIAVVGTRTGQVCQAASADCVAATLTLMADEPTLDAFHDAEGTAFTLDLTDDGSRVELQLQLVNEQAPSPGAPRAQPFTLTFVGPAGTHFPQGTYRLSHPSLGDIDIFLVPVGPQADGCHRYDAVFN